MAHGETLRMRNLPIGPRVRWEVEYTAPNRWDRRHVRTLPTGKVFTIPKGKREPARNEPYVARSGGNR